MQYNIPYLKHKTHEIMTSYSLHSLQQWWNGEKYIYSNTPLELNFEIQRLYFTWL